MEVYIGISLILLSISVLIFVCGIVGYSFKLTKKRLDVTPSKTTSSPNRNGD